MSRVEGTKKRLQLMNIQYIFGVWGRQNSTPSSWQQKTAKCYPRTPRDVPSDFSPPYIGSKRSQESPAAHPSPSTRSYLLSSQQSSPPVHVILRFDHVHHLIGVQFEFTLQLVQALHVLHGLLTVSLLPFLLLLLPTTLTLTDPPQIPANQRIPLGISAHPLGLLGWK